MQKKSSYKNAPKIEEALVRIEEARANHSKILDLSGLSLVSLSEVVQLIKFDRKVFSRIHRLDLSHNSISEIVGLDDFSNLKTLILQKNNISKISGLNSLKHLEALYLNHNSITKIDGLSKLSKLIRLELRHNQIFEIDGLDQLYQLTILDLGYNQIYDTTGLQNLKYLNTIRLDNNQITSISDLSHLRHLQVLNLSSNYISTISGLEKLANVSILFLSDNRIESIEEIQNFNSLKELNLTGNNISELQPLEQLELLESLNLGYNNINNIDESSAKRILKIFNSLKSLKNLEINENPFIFENKKINEEDYVVTTSARETINHLPIFLRDLQNLISENNREIKVVSSLPHKVILIGNSSSGKSTLLEFIKTNKPIDKKKKRPSTEILNIDKWENSTPDVFFYDLGGQDYYHASYNLFLSKDATYVLVWDQQKNVNQINDSDDLRPEDYYSFDVNYWLGNIAYKVASNTTSKISEYNILLVETKIDLESSLRSSEKHSLTFDEATERSHISETFRLSLIKSQNSKTDKARRNFFRSYFLESINKQTEEYEYLENASLDYINFWEENNEEQDVYDRQQLFELLQKKYSSWKEIDETDCTRLFRRFHNAGMVLWLEHLTEIKDQIFIHPKKVQDEILTLLKELREVKVLKTGVFPVSDKFFNDDKFKKYSLLMLHHELLFLDDTSGEEDDYYIVPQLLPVADDGDALFSMAKMGQEFSFSILFSHFMPMGLFNKLICAFGKHQDAKAYFRYQMIFTYEKNTKIWVKCDMEKLRLDFFLADTDNLAEVTRYLFQAVMAAYYNEPIIETKNAVHEVQPEETEKASVKKTTRIDPKKYLDKVPDDVYLSIDGEYYVKHSSLKRAMDDGRVRISAKHISSIIPHRMDTSEDQNNKTEESTDNEYPQKKEFYRYQFREFIDDKEKMPKKVFVSYAHDDYGFKSELETYLINLEREGKIEIWQDGLIKAGDNWDEKINTNLLQADIIIFLVSQALIASNYVHEVELRKTLKGVSEGSCKVVPVLIKQCDWMYWQVYPKGVKDKLEGPSDPLADDGKISNFQFIPFEKHENGNSLKPVNQYEHREDAWMEVINQIRKIL